MVCHNPESNMGNAVGCSPVLQLFQKGILIGLGTDAYTHDMLESLKVLLPMQRHNACCPTWAGGRPPGCSLKTTPKSAPGTSKSPWRAQARRGRRRDHHGLQASPPSPIDERGRAHALRHGGKNCRTTIINGKVLYKDREFVGIDEDKINAFAWSSPRSCGASSTTAPIDGSAGATRAARQSEHI